MLSPVKRNVRVAIFAVDEAAGNHMALILSKMRDLEGVDLVDCDQPFDRRVTYQIEKMDITDDYVERCAQVLEGRRRDTKVFKPVSLDENKDPQILEARRLRKSKKPAPRQEFKPWKKKP